MTKKLEDYLYYEEKNPDLKIYCGNCLEILPLLPKVDLVLTDPPYGIHKIDGTVKVFGKETIYFRDITSSKWDKKPSEAILKMLLSAGNYYVIWGGNYFADTLGSSKGTLVWNKKTGNNSYADGELAWTNVTGTMRILNHQWCGAFKDSERGLQAVHPTQKPIVVMSWAINLSPKSETVLDPFLGSGTTLVACKELNRNGIGIEISEKYCEIAKKRLKATCRPLFTDVNGAKESSQIEMKLTNMQ